MSVSRSRLFSNQSGFTLLEILITLALFSTVIGFYIAGSTIMQRVLWDANPRLHAAMGSMSLLGTQANDDCAASQAVFAWSGELTLDGVRFSATTWGGSGYWSNSSDALIGLTAYYLSKGRILALRAAPVNTSQTCGLFLGAGGQVVAYWEVQNVPTVTDSYTGLTSGAYRWSPVLPTDTAMTMTSKYEQFLKGASLVQPGGALGGPSGGRLLPGFQVDVHGLVSIVLPMPVQSGDIFAYSGLETFEAHSAQSWQVSLRPLGQSAY